MPVLYWRSVGHTHNAFVMETLVDELATRAKVDPIAYRRKLIRPEAKKLHAALDLMEAKSAAWRRKLPKGHAVGIACHESFGTGVACAVDVSIENKSPRIHPLHSEDPGIAVNPLSIESQFQAGCSAEQGGACPMKDYTAEAARLPAWWFSMHLVYFTSTVTI